jgi:hypothetical protein
MRRPNQHEDDRRGASPVAAWLPVVAAMVIMITGCVSTLLVLQMDEFQPKIGDIVVFKPGSQDTDTWQLSIQATIVSEINSSVSGCSLDPTVMATSGGSLIVEGRQDGSPPLYRVHWAGNQTSGKDGGNCGSVVDLAMSRSDLQRLANAAGGFGVGEKGIAQRP